MKLPDLRLFKQSFVSVVITPTKLQVVKLNKSLNRVEIAAQSKIPPGVIANYRVKNHESLVNILKELWSKNKIKEKYVGVVVPEFSTYSKIIELPNLTDTEITEALEWQVQDFLPAPIDEVVLDWKVVSREKTRIQLLVVAVLKDVLIGYIDAIGEAGLSPLVVETPSLSVDRIVDANGTGKMIIYMSAPEALLVISQNHKIVASSVVSANNFNIVVNTALQMMSHYKEAQVENIILAGTGIGQDLIQHLHYNLGKSVTFLDKKIPGLDPAAIQDYLIAISMQYKDPAEPDDDTTINLLPPSWADFYEQKHLKIQSWTLTLIVSIILWTTFLSAMIVFTTLGVQSESLSRDLESEGVTGLRESINEVKRINALSSKIIKLDESMIAFQPIVNQIKDQASEAISINRYYLNLQDGSIEVQGVAQNVYDIPEFKNAVKDLEDFDQVDIPIDTQRLENQAFTMTAIYTPLAKPKKQPVIKLNI